MSTPISTPTYRSPVKSVSTDTASGTASIAGREAATASGTLTGAAKVDLSAQVKDAFSSAKAWVEQGQPTAISADDAFAAIANASPVPLTYTQASGKQVEINAGGLADYGASVDVNATANAGVGITNVK